LRTARGHGSIARGSVMGAYAAVLAGGFVVGPVLLQITGTEGWLPILVAVAAIAGSALPLLLGLGLAPSVSAHHGASVMRMLRSAFVVMVAAYAGGLTDSGVFVLLPIYGLRTGFDVPTSILLLTVFTAGNLLLQIPIGWIADRMSRRRVLLGCASVGVAGAALLPFFLKQPLLLWPLLFIWGGTVFAFYPVALSLLGQNVPANQFASANASFIVFYELGSISGPVVGGAAMDILGPQGLPLAVGAVALAFIAIVFWEKRAKPQPAD